VQNNREGSAESKDEKRRTERRGQAAGAVLEPPIKLTIGRRNPLTPKAWRDKVKGTVGGCTMIGNFSQQ